MMKPLLGLHRWQVTPGAMTAPKHVVVERCYSLYPVINFSGQLSTARNEPLYRLGRVSSGPVPHRVPAAVV
jgi:hypothetical protein